jgi:phosphatidylglycerophosphatase C
VSVAVDAVPRTRTVAAFDVDGTLSYRDTMVPFLMRVRGRAPVARALLTASPILVRTAAGLESRTRAKEALFIRTLRGWWLDELRPIAEEHARDVVDRQLRPDRLQRLRWHQQQGHEVVLVSAALDIYMSAVGRLLGCTATIATRLEVDRRGRVTGRLFGDNVRGPAKQRLLREWLGEDAEQVKLWAYGDSDGDTELLAMADVATLLRSRDRLTPDPARTA